MKKGQEAARKGPSHPDEQIFERLRRIRRGLAASSLDALLVTCPENRFYLSGFLAEDVGLAESAGALLITRHRQFLLTDGRYQLQARRQSPDFELVIYKKGLAAGLKEALTRLGWKDGALIALEASFISWAQVERLKKVGPELSFIPYKDAVFKMRSIKSPAEIKSIRRAVQAAEEVFQQVWDSLREGMTEKEIAFQILEGLYTRADGPSFPPIVASGPNAALPHAVPTDRRIKKAEPVIIDMGARLDGYCSDMTRTIFLDEPSSEMKQVYMTVKRAQLKAQKGIKAGISCRDADLLARQVIEEAGYGNSFVHALGHGVGLAIHEAPALSFRNRKLLRPGMVITVEPGIYIEGKGGVRLENMAVVGVDRLEILNSDRWYYDF